MSETETLVGQPQGRLGSAARSTKAGERRARRAERRKHRVGYVFVLPALLFIFAFMVYPLIYSGYISLSAYDYVYDAAPRIIGFGNYLKAFGDPAFRQSLLNSLVFGAAYFVTVMALSLTFALVLFEKMRRSSIYRTILFLPVVVPLSLACLAFLWILQPSYGLLNFVLGDVLHMGFLTTNWLGNGDTAMIAIIAVAVWATVGFETVIFLAGLQSIDTSILEAADIDGAGKLRRIRYVILPNLKETYIITGVWALIHALKVFEEPVVMTDGGPGTATTVLYQHVYRTAFTYYDMGYASAMGYILTAIILVFIGVNFWANRTPND